MDKAANFQVKRYGYLYDDLCSFENLLKAAKKAQRGKKFKYSTGIFNQELEKELLSLQQELRNQTYQMGEYKHFYIHDPKKRLISAAPYRDRVVQHALCNIVEPIFDKTLIYDSYACRKEKGSHQAVDRFQAFCRSNNFVLKCDVKSYFASIDHGILLGLIKKKIKDPKVLWLIELIINSTPSPGIPIGNLSSQIFANLYLNELDHHLKETVECRFYMRYMDDLVVFDDDKNRLNQIKKTIEGFLNKVKLQLHENKCHIYPANKGVKFLGYKIYPSHRLVLKQNIKRLKKRLKQYFNLLEKNLITGQKIVCSIQSWIGYAMHADSYHLRRRVLTELGISP